MKHRIGAYRTCGQLGSDTTVCVFPQEDKDLVHEFVQNDGLACLIKVGSEADQNYQNYILRGEYPASFISNSLSVLSSLSFQSTHARRCIKSCFVAAAALWSFSSVLVLDCWCFFFKETVSENGFLSRILYV